MCYVIAKMSAIKINTKFAIFEGTEGYGEVSLTHGIPSESKALLFESHTVLVTTSLGLSED